MMLLRLRERFRCWAGFRLVLTRKGIDAMYKAYKRVPSSIAVQSSLPSSHAARRALRGLENTTPSPFSPSKLKAIENYETVALR